MKLSDLSKFSSVQRMIGELKLLTRSNNTEITYLKGLKSFFDHLGIENPDQLVADIKSGSKDPNEVYRDFVVKLAEKNLAPKSVSAWSSSLKKFMKSNGIEITREIPIKIFNVHEDRLPTRDDLKRALEEADVKTRVAMLILSSGGLRVGELHQLKMGDVKMDATPVAVRIRGLGAKERKSRMTFISEQAKEELKNYLDLRQRSGQAIGTDSPVIARDDGGNMTYQNMQYLLGMILKKVGSKEGKRFTIHSHSLRKWFKTQMIAAGVPGPIVDKLTGHSRYLANEYELYTEDQLREWYMKGVENLKI